jgi:hypothetical protein
MKDFFGMPDMGYHEGSNFLVPVDATITSPNAIIATMVPCDYLNYRLDYAKKMDQFHLPSPEHVYAHGASPDAIDVYWASVRGASRYNIYYKLYDGNYDAADAVYYTTTDKIWIYVTGLLKGEYLIWVTAVNEYTESLLDKWAYAEIYYSFYGSRKLVVMNG